ncbi:Ycf66 family protein [Chamaesiphon sp. OTE_75_metabat_556]|uniref:Ycf66 family protein n=1 Tax=Chamaesiphon sp. OTE_75_metabat_556 TaxID=2964692 RepID=UPI00286C7E35|nr:Ycf66 family protein [Chamaesiphon sp. OTE_75_metabat_556]
MLAYILAVLVGTGSVGLYLTAFFLPEIHRKQDFIWSGVGCFYALFLWIYAHQVTGGILVGQTTSVILLGWLSWQTFQLRQQLVPIDRATAIANAIQLPNRNGANQPAPKTPKPAQKPTATVSTPTPVATVEQSIDKTTAPAATKPTSIAKSVTPLASQTPLSEVKIPPANAPVANKQLVPPQPLSITANPNPDADDDRAWIKLEVKPNPVRSKPLGTPVQPPTPLLAAAANSDLPADRSVSKTDAIVNAPTEPIPTVKVDPAQPN